MVYCFTEIDKYIWKVKERDNKFVNVTYSTDSLYKKCCEQKVLCVDNWFTLVDKNIWKVEESENNFDDVTYSTDFLYIRKHFFLFWKKKSSRKDCNPV